MTRWALSPVPFEFIWPWIISAMSDETVTAKSVPERLLQAGCDLGISDWLLVAETMNQAFADATRDPEPMRIDGQPYAHGFFTISLLSTLMASALQIKSSGSATEEGYILNYGFNRLRLIEPVPLGARIRGHFTTSVNGTTERGPVTIIPIDVHIEIENCERPALVAEWLAAWRK